MRRGFFPPAEELPGRGEASLFMGGRGARDSMMNSLALEKMEDIMVVEGFVNENKNKKNQMFKKVSTKAGKVDEESATSATEWPIGH
jgi:hypothetical protein